MRYSQALLQVACVSAYDQKRTRLGVNRAGLGEKYAAILDRYFILSPSLSVSIAIFLSRFEICENAVA